MTSSPTTAALTLSLTGPFDRQGTEAAEGVRLWAEEAGVRLTIIDDAGSTAAATSAYAQWVDSVDLLLGPYSSGLVRAIAPLVGEAGRLLWNHGGSADDLAQPGVAFVPAPASSYFDGVVDEAVARQVDQVVVVRGAGRFARAVADGAITRACERGLAARTVEAMDLEVEDVDGTALLVVGRFEHDVAVVRRLHAGPKTPALLAAVAAGIPAFGQELRPAAEGVLGPVQWWPTPKEPEIGPSGFEFVTRYRYRTGREPSYPAAQAAAAGYLARAAHRVGMAAEDVVNWASSTLLGDFALAPDWPSRYDGSLAGWSYGAALSRLNLRRSTRHCLETRWLDTSEAGSSSLQLPLLSSRPALRAAGRPRTHRTLQPSTGDQHCLSQMFTLAIPAGP